MRDRASHVQPSHATVDTRVSPTKNIETTILDRREERACVTKHVCHPKNKNTETTILERRKKERLACVTSRSALALACIASTALRCRRSCGFVGTGGVVGVGGDELTELFSRDAYTHTQRARGQPPVMYHVFAHPP